MTTDLSSQARSYLALAKNLKEKTEKLIPGDQWTEQDIAEIRAEADHCLGYWTSIAEILAARN